MYTCNLPLKFQGKWIHMRKVMSNFLFLSFFQKSHSFWQASLPIQNHPKLPITEKRRNSTKYLTWNSRGPKFVKKTSMPISVEGLGYIKCYSSSCPRPVKSPSNSIRHNCQKICSCSRRHETILEIKKGHISLGDQQFYYLHVFQRLY